MKGPSLTSLKKKAWKVVSIYVRTRGMDERGKVKCYTCDKKDHWKKMYAGHFVQGRRPSILFQLDIIRVQCVGCNRFRHGNLNVFTPKMINELGLEKVRYYWNLGEQSVKYDRDFYMALYKRFAELTEFVWLKEKP